MNALRQLFAGELPRLVMFDLDGTLLDSVPDLAAAIDRMLLQLGRAPAGVGKVRDWVGNGSRVLVRRALADGLEHARISEEQAALAHQLDQAAAGSHVLLVGLAMGGELLNALGEQGNLHLGGAGVALGAAVIANDLVFLVFW